MEYELKLFEDIINGLLSPHNSMEDKINYPDILYKKFGSYQHITLASFTKANRRFVLQNQSTATSLHPAFYDTVNEQTDLFEGVPAEHLAPEVLDLLQIDKENVQSVELKTNGGRFTIRVRQKFSCESLPEPESKYYYYCDLMREDVIRIKKEMQNAVFDFRTPKEVELYIHNMQQSLISLSFRVLRQLSAPEQATIYKVATQFSNADILNSCFIVLEKLLRFLEKHYLKYLDENVQIPFRSSLIKAYRIPEKLDFVKSALLSCGMEPLLLRLVYAPLLKLNSISLEERITYGELIYANTYLDTFYHEIKENSTCLSTQQIRDVLYRINYNALEMQLYESAVMKRALDGIDELTERMDHLYCLLKLNNQRSCRVNIKFDTGLPSLKEQLSIWIEEEIAYLNKHLVLTTKPQPVNLFTEPDKPKLQSGLTVAQLALFFRLQADAGIISHKIQNDIFKHVAENYKTSKALDISPDSVKNRFYNIDDSTIAVVKEKTIEILNHLQTVQSGS